MTPKPKPAVRQQADEGLYKSNGLVKSKEMISKEAICMIPCFKEAKEDYLVKLGDVIIAIDWTIEEAITKTRTSFRELVQGRIDELREVKRNLRGKFLRESHPPARLNIDSEIDELDAKIAEFKSILASLDGEGDKEDG